MANQPQLPGAEWFNGEFRPATNLAQFSKAYAQGKGLEYRHGPDAIAKVRADPHEIASLGKQVQEQSGQATAVSPEMAESYVHFNRDVEEQYDAMTKPKEQGGLGIKVTFNQDEAYKSPMDLRDEVEQGRLTTYATAADPNYAHPTLPASVNDKFRAVHDVFGHVATGRNFSRHGEAGAFEHHRQMFSPEARLAMASETRAQNSGLVYSDAFVTNKPYPATTTATTESYIDKPSLNPWQARQAKPRQGRLPI